MDCKAFRLFFLFVSVGIPAIYLNVCFTVIVYLSLSLVYDYVYTGEAYKQTNKQTNK